MKILFVTYDLPYPLTTGGKIRSYHLLKQLAKKHDVSLVSFYRFDSQLSSLSGLDFVREKYTFKRRNLYSLSTLAYLAKYPFPIALYYEPSVLEKVDEIMNNGHYDVVHFESFYTSLFVDMNYHVPTVMGTENIEWKIYEEYLKQQFLLFRPILQFELGRIRRFEEKTWKKATYRIAVSEDNARSIEKMSHKKCEIIPNGVDLESFSYKTEAVTGETIKFLFIGSMRYIQNRDAASWLLSSIWPPLKEKVESFGRKPQLLIVGPDTHIITATDTSIKILGEVDNIHETYKETDILLAPIRAGSGTKFKVLEALASGIPVITTPIGIEGIEGLSDKNEVLIACDEEGFESAVSYLLSHIDEIPHMTLRARHIVEKHYSWDAIGKKLLSFYEAIDHHR